MCDITCFPPLSAPNRCCPDGSKSKRLGKKPLHQQEMEFFVRLPFRFHGMQGLQRCKKISHQAQSLRVECLTAVCNLSCPALENCHPLVCRKLGSSGAVSVRFIAGQMPLERQGNGTLSFFFFLTDSRSSKSTQDCAWKSGRLQHMIQWIPPKRGTWQGPRVHMRIPEGSLMR